MAHRNPTQVGTVAIESRAACSIVDGKSNTSMHVPGPGAVSSPHLNSCMKACACNHPLSNRGAQGSDPGPGNDRIIPITVTGEIRVTATAYDNCPICTGKTKDHPAFGITSSGIPATPERTIAVDPQVIPIGTWVYIEGLGVYRAEDTGGAIRGNRVDIFMPTHEDALNFGIQELDVFLVQQTF